MARMQATVMIRVTVDFDDDGKSSMAHQAEQAALFELGLPPGKNSKVGDAYINSVMCTKEGVHRMSA